MRRGSPAFDSHLHRPANVELAADYLSRLSSTFGTSYLVLASRTTQLCDDSTGQMKVSSTFPSRRELWAGQRRPTAPFQRASLLAG